MLVLAAGELGDNPLFIGHPSSSSLVQLKGEVACSMLVLVLAAGELGEQ